MMSEGGEPRFGLAAARERGEDGQDHQKKPASHQNSTRSPTTASVGKPVM